MLFRAVSDAGQPILGLGPGEIALRVAGRECEIESLDLVDSSDSGSESRLIPPFVTVVDGRDVVLVVDEESVPPGSEKVLLDALTAATGTVSSRDRIGLLCTRHEGANLALTSRHTAVPAALAAPHAARVTRAGADQGCQLASKDFDDVRTSVYQSGANFYVLQVVDPAAQSELVDRVAGLERLAGMGGQFARLTSDSGREPKRILERTAACYVASL